MGRLRSRLVHIAHCWRCRVRVLALVGLLSVFGMIYQTSAEDRVYCFEPVSISYITVVDLPWWRDARCPDKFLQVESVDTQSYWFGMPNSNLSWGKAVDFNAAEIPSGEGPRQW